jgi:phage repressor protein C with HTH and peptisase S24 domain
MSNASIDAWRRARLSAAADKAGGAAALGRLLGYKSGAQITHMLHTRRAISEKTIRKIEGLRGYAGWFDEPRAIASDSDTLTAERVPADQPAHYLRARAAPVTVPVLANSGSMGDGADALHEDVMMGELQLSDTWLHREVRPSSNSALRFIHAYGESMAPTFADGDVLLVDTGTRDISIDGVFVLRANGRLYIKRVRQRLDGRYEVSSDNVNVKTSDVLDGSHELDVLGRVVFAWNGRKL